MKILFTIMGLWCIDAAASHLLRPSFCTPGIMSLRSLGVSKRWASNTSELEQRLQVVEEYVEEAKAKRAKRRDWGYAFLMVGGVIVVYNTSYVCTSALINRVKKSSSE